jgi:hypothetical protein
LWPELLSKNQVSFFGTPCSSLNQYFYCQIPPHSNNSKHCSADHHLKEWLEKKRLQDTRRKVAKMAILAREANVRQARLETSGKEKMAYKGKEITVNLILILIVETMEDVI